MGIPHHPGIKATVDGIGDTHPLPLRSKQNKGCQRANYDNNVLGSAWYFAGELYAPRNNDKKCLLINSVDAPKSTQNKRCGLLSKGVLLLHDNARSHTSRMSRDLIKYFGWEVLDNAPYSLDLAPRDFHLFRYLKHNLGGEALQ
ncbi:HTH_48 domain-containing protein [Trichonephila clavipes]|nr:HTH_48 domain-containing protein [Trichonephila clavipes]